MLKRRVIVPLQETASKALCFKLMTVLKAFYVKAEGLISPTGSYIKGPLL
jgi:hypothetical protein